MTPLDGCPVFTAAEMRGAEERAVAAGDSFAAMMDRASRAIAAAVRRLAAGAEVLVLTGPGNNGGDGWIAAATLAAAGHPVRVAQLAEPATDLARAARARWTGPVEALADAQPAPVLLDALFGTGMSRPLADTAAATLDRLAGAAHLPIALDLPSNVDTDTGALLGPLPRFRLTLALAAPKPAHLIEPAAERCGVVRVLDIGVSVDGDARALAPPVLAPPPPNSHKYSRGMVAIVAGAMAGAAALAAEAAMRAGAGYAALLGGEGGGGPHAIVHQPFDDDHLANPRIGALLIGPGLGRDDRARAQLAAAVASGHPLVIDGDALHLLDLAHLKGKTAILTPHAGEFHALFGDLPGSKLDQAREGARRAGAVVIFKGADTVIAAPDGRARLGLTGNNWLSTAGTGDVLAGTVAAMLAARLDPLEAAAAAVWLHADAARRLGASFIADDLAHALTAARAAL